MGVSLQVKAQVALSYHLWLKQTHKYMYPSESGKLLKETGSDETAYTYFFKGHLMTFRKFKRSKIYNDC